MLYTELKAGEKEYKLRMTTRAVVALEKQLGCNPISIFSNEEELPTVTAMVQILHAALQQYEHGITLNDAFDIFDKWLADGHTAIEFVPVIIDIYKVSGLIAGDAKADEKN